MSDGSRPMIQVIAHLVAIALSGQHVTAAFQSPIAVDNQHHATRIAPKNRPSS
jgi:hypothetical protein